MEDRIKREIQQINSLHVGNITSLISHLNRLIEPYVCKHCGCDIACQHCNSDLESIKKLSPLYKDLSEAINNFIKEA